jgi:hypothetical protein
MGEERISGEVVVRSIFGGETNDELLESSETRWVFE